MEKYNESNIKLRAMKLLIYLVTKGNKHLGDRIKRHQDDVQELAIKNIQRVGTHEYADKLLNPKSDEAKEIKTLMNQWNP